MRNVKNKTIIAVITLILILTVSTIGMISTVAAQKTQFGLAFLADPIMGVNRFGQIGWVPTINTNPGNLGRINTADASPILFEPPYVGLKSIWPDAVVTLTRPDGTSYVVNGPFKVRPDLVQGRSPDIVLLVEPDMQGEWTVNFHWPGDASYDAVEATNTFQVGPNFPNRETTAMLSMSPYPAVGLGQDLLINAWVTPSPFTARDIFENYTFTFTSPSGTSFDIGPMNTEAPGTVWFSLPLTEIGDWDITLNFPGDYLHKACTITRCVTVQNDPVTVGYPDTPLPTEPWTFPINTQNREWRNIAGPWYMANYNASTGAWNPYTEAPRTSHVLWKLPSSDQLGGYIGSPHSIETGGGEEVYGAGDVGLYGASPPSITTVMAGRGYYNAGGMIHCVDMRTGEELWAVAGSFDVGDERGDEAVLYDFGSKFRAYDAITGEKVLDVEGTPMTAYVSPYVYYSQVIDRRNKIGYVIKWDTRGNAANITDRIVWNQTDTTLPDGGRTWGQHGRFNTIYGDTWFYMDIFADQTQGAVSTTTRKMIALNLTTGEIIYERIPYDVSNPDTWIVQQGPMASSAYNLWYKAVSNPEPGFGTNWAAIDIATGTLKWISEAADYPWGNFWSYNPIASGYERIFALGYSGVYALDKDTGEILWHYIAEDPYYEEPYGSNIAPDGSVYNSYSFGSVGPIVGGGIVFAPTTEHSPTFLYRGMQLHAIDVFTGDKVWSIKGYYRPDAIAYGILLASDSYNGFTYAFGKGESETAVSTSSKVISKGEGVLIEGTVLDMSTAQPGTPCISSEYMTEWMEYLHMQQPLPLDATGVPVELFAEKGGVTYEIGSVTTDCDGIFKFMWTPPEEGAYSVFAVFNGDESYYSSYGIATLGVDKAVSPAGPIEPEQPTEAPFITTEVAIILAVAVIAVVGIVAFWALRKRK